MKKIKLICVLILLSTVACQKKIEDCIDDVAKNAKTDSGVSQGIANCYSKGNSPPEPQSNNQRQPLVEDCNITWNGEIFVKGVPAEPQNYLVVGFPNSTSLAYLPKNMSVDIGGKLIQKNWTSIKTICPAIGASEIN
jgi:hypothetical protein